MQADMIRPDTGHSPTNPGTMSRRRWLVLGALAVLFAAPMIAAHLWRPDGQMNYGQLVSPARPVEDLVLSDLSGALVRLSDLRHKWVLLYVGGDRCDAVCDRNLYKIERVRLAQNKNVGRVQSVHVAPERLDPAELKRRVAEHPGIIALRASKDVLIRLGAALEQGGHGPAGERIYVLDPLGNLMMSYPSDADPSGIRKDLVRLLKVSQVG